jgi:hypothetical protein
MNPQFEGQISRKFSAVRAFGAARRCFRLVRARVRQPLYASRCRRAQRPAPPHKLQGASAFGIDKLNVARSEIPAVTHVDYSARIQTVHANTNPLFHRLLKRFKGLTGCPVLVNTSFNVRGEPIVCTPEDAFRCFMGNELDLLVVGRCILRKPEQAARLRQNYNSAVELD